MRSCATCSRCGSVRLLAGPRSESSSCPASAGPVSGERMSANSMAMPIPQVERRPRTDALHDWVTTVDHKRIGVLYILVALMFLGIAGVEALVIRVQLMYPHSDFVSPQVFNRMFTMHGTTMIFFVAMPILFGFGNYLVPLMIGA